YEKEEWFATFWQQFRNPFLVAAMMDQHIRKKVKVSDEEVDDYYEKMHYEYTLSQIVVAEEEEALEIRDEIMAGEDFAAVARKYSLGMAAEEGGFVGSNTIGKIHWWVEEALFGMKEGEVSEPLRTSSGYALLKLHRIRKIVPEADKEFARRRIRAIKEKKGIEDYKAKVEKEIGLTFFPDAINIAYKSLPDDIPFEDIVSYKVTRKNAPKLNIPEKYRDLIICQYVDGTYTLNDFEEIYESMGLPERPRRQYGKENIVQIMHKRVFDAVLPAYAEQDIKILEIPEVRDALEKRKEQFLVYQLYKDQIRDNVIVTEVEIKHYYDEHKKELLTAEQRDFSILVTKEREKAQEAALRARKGEDFGLLVKQLSEDPSAKENLGKTGLITEGHYGEYDAVAFSLPREGDISDPMKISRGWAVIKINSIAKGTMPTLFEASQKIKQQLIEEKSENELQTRLEKWSKDYTVNIYEDNLKKAELTRTRL
ncbi:MAG: peptidyl-prolyl cis-trans isomerase, partial [Candidatus Krumholzibacteria bacterium]|nr:peptidyl-prolyl cis-trans isomerase [Candidatus Krumholzibacteria bacterium]